MHDCVCVHVRMRSCMRACVRACMRVYVYPSIHVLQYGLRVAPNVRVPVLHLHCACVHQGAGIDEPVAEYIGDMLLSTLSDNGNDVPPVTIY